MATPQSQPTMQKTNVSNGQFKLPFDFVWDRLNLVLIPPLERVGWASDEADNRDSHELWDLIW
jgi:hypothetical protein